MSARYPFPLLLLPSGRQAGFVLLVLLICVLAHLFVIQWAKNSLAMVSLLDDKQDVIEVTLQTATTPENRVAIPDQPAPATTASETPSPRLPKIPEQSTTATNEAATPVATGPEPAPPPDQTSKPADAVNETALAAVEAPPTEPVSPPEPSPVQIHAPPEPAPEQTRASPEPSAEQARATPEPRAEQTRTPPEPNAEQTRTPPEPVTSQTDASPSAPSTTADTPRLFSRISLPPSADLSYDAVAIKGSSKVEGRGLVKWVQDGRQYSITGEASVLFLSVLSYRSEGRLGEIGILPELYTEKRMGKSSTNTHFHRERQTISFSASTNNYPVKGGEQDRGSVFWQLAGLARGNPEKLQAGLSFDLIIAGSRTADPWRVTVHGKGPVALGQGRTDAWHMSLVRPDGGTDYQLEVWIAPGQDWYPVKIMYVDRKGTSLGLTLSKLEKK